MAGEPILIVDDTPVNLKLTRILLINEGFIVQTASDAEQALEMLRTFHPALALVDIQLPGIDGLELTRRLKQDPATNDIVVVALTAFAMKGDEQKALEAGCDGYITKPIDTRTLAARLRDHLSRGQRGREMESSKRTFSEADAEDLGRRFLVEGLEQSGYLLEALDGRFDAAQASKTVHQWVGAAGLLGYTAISRLAREVEGLLYERPLDSAQLRESLEKLRAAFSDPVVKKDTGLPESVLSMLSGRRIGLVGFPAGDAGRILAALQPIPAFGVTLDLGIAPDSETATECDVVMVYVGPEAASNPWLDPRRTEAGARPLVFVGGRDPLLALDPAVQGRAREFLIEGWKPEEALMRLSFALSPVFAGPSQDSAPAARQPAAGRAEVLVADDDATVLSLVRITLQNYGMDCRTAVNGPDALDAIRRYKPNAAVLDVNMPGMDGYEVLAAVRADGIPVRIVLLTARQQEHDVVRGFTLGADDYVVKPFSPMELVARLKRLLSR